MLQILPLTESFVHGKTALEGNKRKDDFSPQFHAMACGCILFNISASIHRHLHKNAGNYHMKSHKIIHIEKFTFLFVV